MQLTNMSPTKPGEIIKLELYERTILQKELAKAAHIGQSHVSDHISGRRRITLALAIQIEELLEIPSWLIIGLRTALDLANLELKGNNSEPEDRTKLDQINSVVSVKVLLSFLKITFKSNVSKLDALGKWAQSKNLNPWIVLGRLSYETGTYKFH